MVATVFQFEEVSWGKKAQLHSRMSSYMKHILVISQPASALHEKGFFATCKNRVFKKSCMKWLVVFMH